MQKCQNHHVKVQNMLLATQICCHCSTDVKGSDIFTQIVVVSNKAAILDTECMELLFRGAYFMFVTQIAHTSHWRQMVSIIAFYGSSGRLTYFLELYPTNDHTYTK